MNQEENLQHREGNGVYRPYTVSPSPAASCSGDEEVDEDQRGEEDSNTCALPAVVSSGATDNVINAAEEVAIPISVLKEDAATVSLNWECSGLKKQPSIPLPMTTVAKQVTQGQVQGQGQGQAAGSFLSLLSLLQASSGLSPPKEMQSVASTATDGARAPVAHERRDRNITASLQEEFACNGRVVSTESCSSYEVSGSKRQERQKQQKVFPGSDSQKNNAIKRPWSGVTTETSVTCKKRQIAVKKEISSAAYLKPGGSQQNELRGITQRPSGKWQAQLYFAGKSRYIGVFDSREKAALAYEMAREQLKADACKNKMDQCMRAINCSKASTDSGKAKSKRRKRSSQNRVLPKCEFQGFTQQRQQQVRSAPMDIQQAVQAKAEIFAQASVRPSLPQTVEPKAARNENLETRNLSPRVHAPALGPSSTLSPGIVAAHSVISAPIAKRKFPTPPRKTMLSSSNFFLQNLHELSSVIESAPNIMTLESSAPIKNALTVGNPTAPTFTSTSSLSLDLPRKNDDANVAISNKMPVVRTASKGKIENSPKNCETQTTFTDNSTNTSPPYLLKQFSTICSTMDNPTMVEKSSSALTGAIVKTEGGIKLGGSTAASMSDESFLPRAIDVRGITQRPSGKWQAQLYYAGKSRYIGAFETREKASLAYEIAREKLKADSDPDIGNTQSTESVVVNGGLLRGGKTAEEKLYMARVAAFSGVSEPDRQLLLKTPSLAGAS